MPIGNIGGLSYFAEAFSDYSDQYIIIGGIATFLLVERAGVLPRATKDIDLAILAKPHPNFLGKLREFFHTAGYQTECDQSTRTQSYRFRNPRTPPLPQAN